jgi:hypothetical protein
VEQRRGGFQEALVIALEGAWPECRKHGNCALAMEDGDGQRVSEAKREGLHKRGFVSVALTTALACFVLINSEFAITRLKRSCAFSDVRLTENIVVSHFQSEAKKFRAEVHGLNVASRQVFPQTVKRNIAGVSRWQYYGRQLIELLKARLVIQPTENRYVVRPGRTKVSNHDYDLTCSYKWDAIQINDTQKNIGASRQENRSPLALESPPSRDGPDTSNEDQYPVRPNWWSIFRLSIGAILVVYGSLLAYRLKLRNDGAEFLALILVGVGCVCIASAVWDGLSL